MSKRRSFSEEFKAKIALEAVKELKTVNEIASEHGLHPNQVTKWKKQLIDNASSSFKDGRQKKKENNHSEDHLYQQIGQLKVELDWLKKKSEEL